MAGHDAYLAYGYEGQFIFVVPDLKLTAVVSSSTSPRQTREERRGHRQGVYDILEEDLIPAVRNGRMSLRRSNGTAP